jgi:hypothetical protein
MMVGIKTTFAPATIAVATHDYHDECGNACAFDGAILVPSKAFWHLKRYGITTMAQLRGQALKPSGLRAVPGIGPVYEDKILRALKAKADKLPEGE